MMTLFGGIRHPRAALIPPGAGDLPWQVPNFDAFLSGTTPSFHPTLKLPAMKLDPAAAFLFAALLALGLPGAVAIPVDPIPRPGTEPSLTTRTLLEKTIFKVDVLTLELWLGPETVQRLTHLLPLQDDAQSREAAARIALDSRDAWAELVFRRGVSLDQFLGGIDENMRRARDAGLITSEGYHLVATGLPRSYAPLAAGGIAEGDRILYRVTGDTLRTVYQRAGGELVVDQTDIGPERRLSLLGSFFVKGSDFRKGLVGTLPQSRAD
jgi:hypothetical protein